MKKAKIELKRVKIFNGHDGIGLDCDLYINSKKVAHIFDAANGGEWDVDAYGKDINEIKANWKLIEDLRAYIETLPDVPSTFEEDKMESQDLESFVNDMLMKIEKEKLAKKAEKKFPTHIIAGVPGGDSIREFSYGKPAVLLSRVPVAKLQADINIIKGNLKAGEQILNTNLQALGIQI